VQLDSAAGLRPSPTGPDREEVNYKPWSVTDDPAWRTDPAQLTTDWRRPPLNDPESRLLGAEYECNPTRAAGVVVQPSSWLFAGTGVRAGSRLPGLVGDEYDRVRPGVPRPPRVEVLLHSPVRCRGASFADTRPDAPITLTYQEFADGWTGCRRLGSRWSSPARRLGGISAAGG
jgi:hypothetical protein